jgi:PTH1 family peptidyl-tRNA hydrolase
LGTHDIPRMRIGIKTDAMMKYEDPADFVLGRFSKAERQQLEILKPKLESAIMAAVEQGLDFAMNKYNGIWLDAA